MRSLRYARRSSAVIPPQIPISLLSVAQIKHASLYGQELHIFFACAIAYLLKPLPSRSGKNISGSVVAHAGVPFFVKSGYSSDKTFSNSRINVTLYKLLLFVNCKPIVYAFF